MCRHATLADWTTKSSIWHATSVTPTGPYSLVDMAVQPWSHNAMLSSNPAGGYLLYQIGDAVTPPSEWEPCYNSSVLPSGTDLKRDRPQDVSGRGPRRIPQSDGSGIYIRSAPDLTGPWTLEVSGLERRNGKTRNTDSESLSAVCCWHNAEYLGELGDWRGKWRQPSPVLL